MSLDPSSGSKDKLTVNRKRRSEKPPRKSGSERRKSADIASLDFASVEQASAAERALQKLAEETPVDPKVRAQNVQKAKTLASRPEETPRNLRDEFEAPTEFSSELFKLTTGKRSQISKGHSNARVWVYSRGYLTYVRPVAPGLTQVYEAPDGKPDFYEAVADLIVKKCDQRNDIRKGRFAFTVETSRGKVITLLAESEELRRYWIYLLTTPLDQIKKKAAEPELKIEVQDSLKEHVTDDMEPALNSGRKDKPLPAVPPIWETLPQGGIDIKWRGHIKHQGNSIKHTFEVHFAYGEISGQGTDNKGLYSWTGNYNKWGQMTLIKKYPDHEVTYKGVAVGEKFIGEMVEGDVKSTFIFNYVPHIDEQHFKVEDGKRVRVNKSGPPDPLKSKIFGSWDFLVVGKKYDFTIHARDFKGEKCSEGHADQFQIEFVEGISHISFGGDELDAIFALAADGSSHGGHTKRGKTHRKGKENKDGATPISDEGEGQYRFSIQASIAGDAKFAISCGGVLMSTPSIKFLPGKGYAGESMVKGNNGETLPSDVESRVNTEFSFVVNVYDIFGNSVSRTKPEVSFRLLTGKEHKINNITVQFNGKDHVLPYNSKSNLDDEFSKIVGDTKFTPYSNDDPVPKGMTMGAYFDKFGGTPIYLEEASQAQDNPDTIDARRIPEGASPSSFVIYLTGGEKGLKALIFGEKKKISHEVKKFLDNRGLSISSFTCRLPSGTPFDPNITMGQYVSQYQVGCCLLHSELSVSLIGEKALIVPKASNDSTSFTVFLDGLVNKKKIKYDREKLLSDELKAIVSQQGKDLSDYSVYAMDGIAFDPTGVTLEDYVSKYEVAQIVLSLKTLPTPFKEANNSDIVSLILPVTIAFPLTTFHFVLEEKKHSIPYDEHKQLLEALTEAIADSGKKAEGYILKNLDGVAFDPNLTLGEYIGKYRYSYTFLVPNTLDVSKLDVNHGRPRTVTPGIEIQSIMEIEEGSWDITVIPERVGQLIVNAMVDKKTILNSPFQLKVTPGHPVPEKTIVSGTITKSPLFQPQKLSIETFDALGNPSGGELNIFFATTISGMGLDRTFGISTRRTKAGVTEVEYEPKKIGKFFLHILLGTHPAPGSPFELQVHRGGPELIDPPSCFASGTCLGAMTLGEENIFDVSIVDKAGNVTDPGCKCELKFPEGEPPEYTIGPEVDGKIRVSCTVKKLGDLIMHVLINGKDIRNSPFLIASSQADAAASQSTCDFDKETIPLNEATSFTITVRDTNQGIFRGNPNLELLITSMDEPLMEPEEISKTTISFEKATGTAHCTITPLVKGMLLIIPMIDGNQIEGAPFSTDVQ